MSVAPEIIGRDEELGAVRAFVSRVGDGPGALVLSGEAGIGKTILWEAGVEEARGRFSRVVTCRGVEAEASFAFAGLSELLAGCRPRGGVGARAASSPCARGGAAARGARRRGSRRTRHRACLARCAAGARRPRRPGSRRCRRRTVARPGLCKRACRSRFGVFAKSGSACWRPSGRGPRSRSAVELDRFFPEERLERLSLGPLTLGALHRLLEERLGLELTRPELARVQEATAGNPFFALELGRELVRTNTRPTPGQALRVPESLRELLGGRLDRLPTHTGDVLLQAAALARPTVELVTAAYGDRERVLEALEAAVRRRHRPARRLAHSLCASLARLDCRMGRRRSGNAAPCIARSQTW